MNILNLHLRLFLIVAMAMLPMQQLFAMQAGMHAEDSVIHAVVTADDAVRDNLLTVLDMDCGKHDGCGDCQESAQCGSCSISPGIVQIELEHNELSQQYQLTSSEHSFYSIDLLPDYRPPRIS